MRHLRSLALVPLLALAGCLESGAPSDDSDGQTLGASSSAQGPVEDIRIEEMHDLSLGLAETTWSFDVARGATGHVHVYVRDIATGENAVSADACFTYTIDGSTQEEHCPTALVFSYGGTTSAQPWSIVSKDATSPGTHVLTISADPQPNEIVFDIMVDNP